MSTLRRLGRILIGAGLFLPAIANTSDAARLEFHVDNWITECDNSELADCSVTGLFQQTNLDGRRGSFALVIIFQSNQLAVVGKPSPIRARLQVDNNNPTECAGERYCIFPSREARRVIGELPGGSLVLVDVHTAEGAFHFSLNTIGYRASLSELEANGYDVKRN